MSWPSAVTNLEDIVDSILCPDPDPQLLDCRSTSLIFSFAHLRKATAPLKFANTNELWLNDI